MRLISLPPCALAFVVVCLLATGCKKTEAPEHPPTPVTPALPEGPPTVSEKAPAPPGVQDLMRRLVNALNQNDADAVAGFFMDRETFLGVSQCEPATVVDEVMSGRAQAVERARSAPKGAILLKGIDEGELTVVKRGQKPDRCRAKVDVTLFRAPYRWEVQGKAEVGEAHWLRVGGVWLFVKL